MASITEEHILNRRVVWAVNVKFSVIEIAVLACKYQVPGVGCL